MPKGGWRKNKNGLTDQQQKFADWRRTHPEESDGSCYMRFYKVKSLKVAAVNACNLLKNPSVANYLANKQLKAEEKADYNQEQWVADAIRLKEMCMGDQDVKFYAERLNDDGEIERVELTKRVFEPTTAKSTLELLAKFKKWMEPDNQKLPPGGVNITNGLVFVGADGFGGYTDKQGIYHPPLKQPEEIENGDSND